jgi:hypothetical protein
MAKNLFKLESLFHAIHDAISQATAIAKQGSLNALKSDYFTQVHDTDGKPTEVWKPKTIDLVLPHLDGDVVKQEKTTVPIYALVNHQAVAMHSIKLEFDVELHGLEGADIDDDNSPKIVAGTPNGMFAKKTFAKVEVTFVGQDASEGVMKLNDRILKTFPS